MDAYTREAFKLGHGFRLAHCSLRFEPRKKVAQIEIYWTVWKASLFFSFAACSLICVLLRRPVSSLFHRFSDRSLSPFPSRLLDEHPSLSFSLSHRLFYPCLFVDPSSFISSFKFVWGVARFVRKESRLTRGWSAKCTRESRSLAKWALRKERNFCRVFRFYSRTSYWSTLGSNFVFFLRFGPWKWREWLFVGTIAGFVRFPFEEIPVINQLVILAVRLRVAKRSRNDVTMEIVYFRVYRLYTVWSSWS